MNAMIDCRIPMSLQLLFTLPDSRISLTLLTFPSCEAWRRVDSIGKQKNK